MRPSRRVLLRAALGLCALPLVAVLACTVGPNYVEPRPPMADEWLNTGAPQLQRGESAVARWWEVLNDPALNELVEAAYRQNPSLHAAGVRVLEAQARRAVAFGLLFPQQQEAFGELSWNQASENAGGPIAESSRTLNRLNLLTAPLGTLARSAVGDPGIDGVYHNWQFGFGASWELDLWGRYRRGIEAADAEILATLANYDDVLVSLIAEVATNYVLLRSLEEQLAVTRSNVTIQRRGYELAVQKFEGGTTTALDPAQAAALLHDTEAQEANLTARIAQTRSTLCVLLGLPPQDLKDVLGQPRPIPAAPERIAIGIPAELLRRRPDVRRAERVLAAQSALIGVATADLYPSFSLSGNLGLSAEHFGGLWQGSSFQAFAGPSFRWAILNYGRIENNIRVQDAAYQALISEYESVVLRAQGEVEAALAGYLGSQQQVRSLAKSVDASTQAVDLAEKQYRGGIADYTRVLNTQDFLTVEQSRLVATRGAVALNLIAVYRALGGGWELREAQQLVPAPIKEQMKERTNWGGMIDSDRFPQRAMPTWLIQLHESHPVAHAIAVLSLVALTGLALGSLRVRGIGLGAAGVLFSGIIVGHFGQTIDRHVLEFTKEFGLVLFVFTIGLQLGPGFFSALRSQGLALNLLSATIVLLGATTAAGLGALLSFDECLLPGLLAGATTNTPSLAAGQQALAALPGIAEDRVALPALAYAVAYPVGIVGIIAAMLLLKAVFRVNPALEAQAALAAQPARPAPLERRTLIVENPRLAGLTVADVPAREETGVIISRLRPAAGGPVVPATAATRLQLGDLLLAVGTAAALDRFQRVVGPTSAESLREASGTVTNRRVIVTSRAALGKSVPELGLDQRFGVIVTRITRADLEMTAVPDLRLQFGDMLQIVGAGASLDQAAAFLGNSLRALNETHFIPLFTGILLGVLAGLLPISLPGLPTPVRLGLAGGPLIVALLVGRLGHLGPLVWHMPTNANLAFRELGIVLFLACVGLSAGARFFEMVFSPAGALWLLAAACIAVGPLLAVGVVARLWLKLDYITLSGLLAGSMTDPPALAFANAIAGSDAPSVAYATVYPLTMVLRIVVAQILVLFLIA